MKEALGLTDDQVKDLAEKQRASDREVEQKVAKIKADAREKLLKEVLTPAQRDKLQKMLGSKYEMKERDLRRTVESLKKQG